MLALLHRFRNVVLWLNGHTHTNAVRARHDSSDSARGFWEVTTCSVVDWPCQARLVEIVDSGGYLSIVCTMADHDTPLGPLAAGPLQTTDDLAALHRELAANMPIIGLRLGPARPARRPQRRAPAAAAVPAGPRCRWVAGASRGAAAAATRPRARRSGPPRCQRPRRRRT